jgi:hypothetical protein
MNNLTKFEIETIILVLQKEIKQLEIYVYEHLKNGSKTIAGLYQDDILALNKMIDNLNQTK